MKPRRKLKSNCGFVFCSCSLVLQKRKEGAKQVLNSLGKQIPRLTKKIENQENLVDKLLHQKTVHLFLVVRLLTYFLSTDDFEIRIYHLRV